MDLSAQCLVSGESSREEPWMDAVKSTLRRAGDYQSVSYKKWLNNLFTAKIVSEIQAVTPFRYM